MTVTGIHTATFTISQSDKVDDAVASLYRVFATDDLQYIAKTKEGEVYDSCVEDHPHCKANSKLLGVILVKSIE